MDLKGNDKMDRIKGNVKFAIIGCGRISYRHIEAIQANSDAQLVALCDLNLDRAREMNGTAHVKVYEDYREMFDTEDIDVVCIMTPSGMHAEHAIDVITRYKKNVVLEKPMCLRVSDGLKLIDVAKVNNIKLFIVHQNRFNKAIQKIKTAIDSDLPGRIALATVRIRWSRGQAYYDRDPWRGTWALDGGALTNQAIHHIDLLRWLTGNVEALSAVAKTQFVDVAVEDTACAWLKFENGALGVIEATTATRPLNKDLEASISLLGENGTVIVEGAAVNKLTLWTFDDSNMEEFSEDPPNVYGFGHNHIIDNVVDVLRKGGEPLVSAEDALESVRLLSALYRSIEMNGRQVILGQNPVSERLGIIDAASEKIADLYRTNVVMKGRGK